MRGYRYEALDGVRGLAAQAVVITHALEMAFLPAHGTGAGITGWIGRASVMLFFVLSGFVIATSLSRSARRDGRFLVAYAVHRVARIAPPLVFAIGLTFAVGALGQAGVTLLTRSGEPYTMGLLAFLRGITLTFAPTDATFVIDNPLWSLRQEAYLYAVAAFVALGVVGRGAARALGFALAAGLVFATANRFFYLQSLALFGAGAASALLGGHPGLHRLATSPALWPIAALALAAPLAFVARPDFVDAMSAWGPFLAYQAVLGLPLALGLLALATESTPVARVFAAFEGAATFSYTLYVVHMPVLVLVFSLRTHLAWMPGWIGDGATLLVAWGAAQALAIAVARVLERPKPVRTALFHLLGRLGWGRSALERA
ncbi:acyltransferase family protein [Methylobacterium gossipiicola]|uniref:Peptidoglycan/LPS O-acetylase OafA/YrhL, contains acyltransferase and SGNH-hydrolase domains n=1 Tax=Methylobacterium gossipiicola TaxID=582675 RepID=A0A1I2R4Y0_9HYPH|nr:acyltransferase [Methylobacterium gossipiicola]SFG35460.1 Peptidoglycan/LPS O-acetylase OafA/YrhL, contains acyltransferase and SGNH-hydrolase domains [Methylobacterium gossipiicola]